MSTWQQYGEDTGGRPVRWSPRFAAVLDQVADELGWAPIVTQGGFMGDLAADASSTTHDGDAVDYRIRHLSADQADDLVRVLRANAIGAWVRNEEHGGFDDPHVHAVPGPWAKPAPAALRQWYSCRVGLDGLKSNGPDYHPHPLATEPPEDDMTPEDRKRLRAIEKDVARLLDLVGKIADKDARRDEISKARHEQIREEHAE